VNHKGRSSTDESGHILLRFYIPFLVAPSYVFSDRWDTPDGDRFAIDFFDAVERTVEPPLVVMTHGLESRSDAPLTKRMARAYHRRGYDVAVLNFRSCAEDDDIPRRPGGYHLGFTADLDFATRRLFTEHHGRAPKRIYLSGFSLGGNVILKLLGELGDQAACRNGIVGAAVTCVPFRPEDAEPLLGAGFNKAVYSGNFLRSLKPKAQRQVDALGLGTFPASFSLARCLAAESIGDFDDAFIAVGVLPWGRALCSIVRRGDGSSMAPLPSVSPCPILRYFATR
jgi:predicted alpha/beta-fold hydrolase